MPSRLAKVQKAVTKKKGNKIQSLHENSRDAKRLRRAGLKDDRVARLSAIKQKNNVKWLDRISFFQHQLPETLHPLDLAEIQRTIENFIDRNAEEVEQLKSERRAGRPRSTRQVLLEQQIETERKEYEGGFWLPNLQDEETLIKLEAWTGDWSSAPTLRFVRVSSAGEVKDSSFPPRGAS